MTIYKAPISLGEKLEMGGIWLETFFLSTLIDSDVKIKIKKEINRILLFFLMHAHGISQKRSENPKKWLSSRAYIPF